MNERQSDSTANTAIWFLVFFGLGLLLIVNRRPEDIWPVFVAALSFGAATVMLFKLLFRGRG